MRAVVDGVPYAVEVVRDTALPASVVIAIDTSASMDGAPLEAARQAAISLVERLDVDDRVAVLSFSDETYLMSAFEAGREGAVAGLSQLWLGGNTALYDALGQSLALLEGETDRTRAIVLLSDGQDTVTAADAATSRRAEVLDALGRSDVQLHAFALGEEADYDFLAEAAQRGEGGYWSVTDTSALAELFSFLGARLGAATEVRIPVPPLERGAHHLVVRARVAGRLVEASATFEASNDQFLSITPRPADEAAPGKPMILDIASAMPEDALAFSAEVAGRAVEVLPSPPRVLLDPWSLPPGTANVVVRASTARASIAEASVDIDVPALEPELSFALEPGGGRIAVVSGRAQTAGETLIVARSGDTILADGAERELRFEVPERLSSITVELVADGRVVLRRTETLPALPAAATAGPPLPAIGGGALVALAAVGGAWLVLRSRGRGDTTRWEPSGRTALVGRQAPGASSEARSALGTVVVQPPAGEARQYELRRRPLSIGSSEECDVALDDEAIASVHARLYALGDGEFRIHGIAPRGLPDREIRDDEWLVVRHGEQIVIGRHLLTVYATEPSLAPGGAV